MRTCERKILSHIYEEPRVHLGSRYNQTHLDSNFLEGRHSPVPENDMCSSQYRLTSGFGRTAVQTVWVFVGTVRDRLRDCPRDCSNGVGFCRDRRDCKLKG